MKNQRPVFPLKFDSILKTTGDGELIVSQKKKKNILYPSISQMRSNAAATINWLTASKQTGLDVFNKQDIKDSLKKKCLRTSKNNYFIYLHKNIIRN